jgi:hypothetical protein
MLAPVFTTLRAAAPVTALIGDPPRVYRHGAAPENVTKPYATWVIAGDTPENELSAVPGVDRQVVQIDCWSLTDAGVEALAIAVRNAIEPVAHMTAIVTNIREPETLLYRIGLQFDWFVSR